MSLSPHRAEALFTSARTFPLRLPQAVPLFHFYLGDKLVDKFATRDKSRILETIQKYIPGFQAGEPGGGESQE